MSSQGAAETSEKDRVSSEKISVVVHVFACGHGDTILIRLPGNRWVLVDCHLPGRDGTRERFFQFVESEGIKRLDLIFQTHPHFDHFHGMIEVLDYFSRDGRSVGYYCDGGVCAWHVRDLIWGGPLGFFDKSRYGKLQDRLDELDDEQIFAIDDRHEPMSPPGYINRIDLIPIAPSAGGKRRIARADIPKVAKDRQARVEANAMSVVLVLSIREGDRVCNVLLAADADSDSLELAQDAWLRKNRETTRSADFDVVKVPHHGSIGSHSTRLCHAKRNDRECCVGAISVGEKHDVLPDREVLRDYQDAGWTVMVTTGRRRAARRNRPSELADRNPPAVQSFETHSITITVTADGVVAHGPDAAVVRTGDLVLYESAG